MVAPFRLRRTALVGILALSMLNACTYPINYRLNRQTISSSNSQIPLKVQVASFSDARDTIERNRDARKSKGGQDVNDYTYDKRFSGVVDRSISQMMVKHLAYSGTFASVQLSSYNSDQINDAALDELAQNGVDAVMTGSIENFYGYYDHHPGAQMALSLGLGLGLGLAVGFATVEEEEHNLGFGATYKETKMNPIAVSLATSFGTGLGSYLESTAQRKIERHVRLSAKLIDTRTRSKLWEDTFEIKQFDVKSMPGFNTDLRQFELAVGALREATNAMVGSLAKVSLTTAK